MPSHSEVAQLYLDAWRSRDDAKIASIAEHLADDAAVSSPLGGVSGKQAVLDRLKNPPAIGGSFGGAASGMMGMISFAPPVEDGSKVTVKANLPSGLPIPIKGIAVNMTFNEQDKIARIEVSVA